MRKTWKASFLILLLCAIFSVQVFAGNGTQDGLQVTVTTDKENYQSVDKIQVTINVTNTGENPVEDVEVKNAIPKGLKLAEESKADTIIDVIEAGETKSMEIQLIKDGSHQEDANTPNDSKQKTESVKTGDYTSISLWIGLVSAALAILAVMFIFKDKKNRKQIFSLFLCMVLGISVLEGFAVQAAEAESRKSFSVATDITVDGQKYTLDTAISYKYQEEQLEDVVDPDAEELEQILNDKTGVCDKELSDNNPDDAVTGVEVSYELKNGDGGISISDISEYSYFAKTAGAVGAPVDIQVIGDEVEKAKISFRYDRNKLNNVDEKNLGVCWYDEENHQVVLLENTVIDTENQTVSVETTHFSKYIVVDTVEWYEMWAKEQLVVRDNTGNTTPYYNIVFALDSSGSMGGEKNKLCRAATLEFVKMLKGKDKISVMSFDNYASVYMENQIIEDTTMDEIESCINRIGAYGGTNYYDGLNTALSLIVSGRDQEDDSKDEVSRQSLLVFLSDGEPTKNYTQDMLDRLKYLADTVNCRCVTIGLGSNVREYYLKEMASYGNGEYMYVSNANQLSEIFETINNWYVGSTKDTDLDGIPDIVETTGMRTEWGYFIRTNPDDADTDGDGVNDGDEMGEFIYRDNGKSFFIINSDPSIPTCYSDQARITVNSVEMKVGKTKYKPDFKRTFEEIKDWFGGYRILYSASPVMLYQPKYNLSDGLYDGLSETVYSAPENVKVRIEENADCAKVQVHEYEYDYPENTIKITVNNECKNNLLSCKSKHDFSAITTLSNGIVDDSKAVVSKEDPKPIWNEIVECKKCLAMSEYEEKEAEMIRKTEDIMNKMDAAADDKSKGSLDKISVVVEEQFGIPGEVPENIKEAFLEVYRNKISSELKTNFESYENVKTAADLVNKVSKEFVTEEGTFVFYAEKTEYICEFKISGWGACYTQGTIKNTKTGKTYMFGSTNVNKTSIENEMNYLKQFAELKIEEAKKEVISDAGSILHTKELKNFIEKTMKSQFYEILSDYNPKLSEKVKKLGTTVEKFEEFKKDWEKVSKIDLTGTEPDEIVEKITDYNKNLKKLMEHLTDLSK